MSHDEIVFDDLQYREPERRLRPDHDRRWAWLAYEVPHATDLPIFLDRQTADAIERHALRDTSVELGGILLGKECIDEETGLPFVWVTKSLEAKHYENTQASFTYTHDSWEEITRERERQFPDLDIVGWYHTHPDFGIFLSSHDLFIHRNFFAQPLQVAYVVDPIRQTRGFFYWRDDGLEQVGGYYLVTDRNDRLALARLVNDLENIPNTEGGGGSLSPRLEAELIAMLTRPSPSHTTAADRAQTAAMFTFAGGVAGMLLLALAMWFYTLNGRVADQTQRIADLEELTKQSAARHGMALDVLLDQASNVSADKFTKLYDEAVRDRDDARRKIATRAAQNDALADKLVIVTKSHVELEKTVDSLKKELEPYRKESKDYPDLLTRVRKLESDVSKKSRTIADLNDLLDTTEGRNAEKVVRKYDRTWYAAAIGWFAVVLLTLGLLALLSQPRAVVGPVEEPEGPPEGTQPPPHRIV